MREYGPCTLLQPLTCRTPKIPDPYPDYSNCRNSWCHPNILFTPGKSPDMGAIHICLIRSGIMWKYFFKLLFKLCCVSNSYRVILRVTCIFLAWRLLTMTTCLLQMEFGYIHLVPFDEKRWIGKEKKIPSESFYRFRWDRPSRFTCLERKVEEILMADHVTLYTETP